MRNDNISPNIDAMLILEYSISQQCFHIHSLFDLFKCNYSHIAKDKAHDYLVVYVFANEQHYLKSIDEIKLRVLKLHEQSKVALSHTTFDNLLDIINNE